MGGQHHRLLFDRPHDFDLNKHGFTYRKQHACPYSWSRSDRPLDCSRPEAGRHTLLHFRIGAFGLTLQTSRMEYGNTLVAATARSSAPSRSSGEAEGGAE